DSIAVPTWPLAGLRVSGERTTIRRAWTGAHRPSGPRTRRGSDDGPDRLRQSPPDQAGKARRAHGFDRRDVVRDGEGEAADVDEPGVRERGRDGSRFHA